MNSFGVSGLAFRPSPASSRSFSPTPTFRPHAAGQTPGSRHGARNGRHQVDRSGPVRDPLEIGSAAARTSSKAGRSTFATISTAATSSAGHQQYGARPGRKLPGPSRTRSTTQTQPRRRPSLTGAWNSGSAWSPTCGTTQPTTAGGSSFARARSSVTPTPSTGAQVPDPSRHSQRGQQPRRR